MLKVPQVKRQGSTEYLMILAAVLVVAAVGIYYVTTTGGYPPVSAIAVKPPRENIIRINVESGSIAAGDWQWYIKDNQGEYYNASSDSWSANVVWNSGEKKLKTPYVELGEFNSGIWRC